MPHAHLLTPANDDIEHAQVSDVIGTSEQHETGARNQRRLVAVYCNKEAGFEVIHGLLNRVMEVLGVPLKGVCVCVCARAHLSLVEYQKGI